MDDATLKIDPNKQATCSYTNLEAKSIDKKPTKKHRLFNFSSETTE